MFNVFRNQEMSASVPATWKVPLVHPSLLDETESNYLNTRMRPLCHLLLGSRSSLLGCFDLWPPQNHASRMMEAWQHGCTAASLGMQDRFGFEGLEFRVQAVAM